MPYTYFVSYSYQPSPGGFGFGSTAVDYDRKVSRFADIEVLTQKVCERLHWDGLDVPLNSIVVMNYQILTGPEED